MSSFATCLESEQSSTKTEPLLLLDSRGAQGAYPAISVLSLEPETSGTAPGESAYLMVHQVLAERARAFVPCESDLAKLEEEAQSWARSIEAPNAGAIEEARAILGRLQAQSLAPTRVIASAEGGVGICFGSGSKYADIECMNSGENFGVISDGSGFVEAFNVDLSFEGHKKAITRICEFFRS